MLANCVISPAPGQFHNFETVQVHFRWLWPIDAAAYPPNLPPACCEVQDSSQLAADKICFVEDEPDCQFVGSGIS